MRKLFWILLAIAVAVGLSFVIQPRHVDNEGTTAPSERPASTESSIVVQENYVRYPGEDGKTAFELLREVTPVEFQQYDFGIFVESIGGVRPQEGFFWKLYVNGQESQVGADQLETSDSDVLEWKIEEIQS